MFNTLIWSFYWWFRKGNCSWSLNTYTSCIPIYIRTIEVQVTLHGVNTEYMNRTKIKQQIYTELWSSYEEWFSGSWMLYLSALRFYSFDLFQTNINVDFMDIPFQRSLLAQSNHGKLQNVCYLLKINLN